MSRVERLRAQLTDVISTGGCCQGCYHTCHQSREFCDGCWRKLSLPLRMRISSAMTPYQRTSNSWVSQEFRDAAREAREYLRAQIVGGK